MPKHTGRRRKKGAISTSPYEVDRFRAVLNQIGGDPAQWVLKGQWRKFNRTYFNVTNTREESVRSAYLFYKKHKQTLSVGTPFVSLQNFSESSPDPSQISSSSSYNAAPSSLPATPTTASISTFPSPRRASYAPQFPNLESITNSVVLINCGHVSPITLDTNRPQSESFLPLIL